MVYLRQKQKKQLTQFAPKAILKTQSEIRNKIIVTILKRLKKSYKKRSGLYPVARKISAIGSK